MKDLKELQKEVHRTAMDHGFWTNSCNIGEKIALIHSEISETLEAYRQSQPLSSVAEELADTVIRILDLAEYLGMDIQSAIEEKHKINMNRPFLHGKRF